MNETRVRSPGQEDPLEKKMAARSSILARELPGTEEPGRLQAMGSHESDMIYRLNHHNTKYHNKQFVGTIEVKRVLKSWRMVIFSKWSVWGLTKWNILLPSKFQYRASRASGMVTPRAEHLCADTEGLEMLWASQIGPPALWERMPHPLVMMAVLSAVFRPDSHVDVALLIFVDYFI